MKRFSNNFLSRPATGSGTCKSSWPVATYYGRGWLSLGQAARLARLDQFAFGAELAERGIPRNYGVNEALEDLADARRQ